ncbi:tripartite motif-containing protein 30A-like [Mastomys coucha]|uniref:tripartite motif-containing protein 30A-like n=1 Tax=Mastomys coucha TaxID=35658 RepID=UPI00126278C1|nr:tripartite motif-containing protein 30A-like [Mastomys coucha]
MTDLEKFLSLSVWVVCIKYKTQLSCRLFQFIYYMYINTVTSFSKKNSLSLPVFPQEFLGLCLGTAVLLITQLVSATNPFPQEKLQAALQKLMENDERCDEWWDDLQLQRTDWENQIQSDVENIQIEFKGLREIVDSKENEELQKLKKEKEDVMKKLDESEKELGEQRELVRDLISDVEHQLELSTMEMLQDVTSVLTRSQTLTLTQPQAVPPKRRRKFQAPDLKGMLQANQGLMDVQQYWVHITLHAKKHSAITINKEKGQIKFRSFKSWNLEVSETYHLGVLGYPAISSGKHYWEVDVSKSDAWLLGLNDGKRAQPQLHSKDEMGFLTKHHSNVKQNVIYQPKCGYWIIGMENMFEYNAFDECSITHNPSVLALYLPSPPSRVGVFLDREACTLSFYDVSHYGALIYRFYDPAFPGKVYPYFNPKDCPEPITVCGPPS